MAIFSLGLHMAERERKRREGDGNRTLSAVSCHKDKTLIQLDQGSTLLPPLTIGASIKTLCLIIVTLRIEISTYEFWIYTSFHSINIITMSE